MTKLAPDGFMLNFVSVLYELSRPIDLDKVEFAYPFHPESRIKLTDESRLKMSQEEVETFVKTLGKIYINIRE